MSMVEDFIAAYAPSDPGLRSEFERTLRLMLTGDPIEINALGHTPLRPAEAAVIASMADRAMVKTQVVRIFREMAPAHARSAQWIWRNYLAARDAWERSWGDESDPTSRLAEVIGRAQAAAKAWQLSGSHPQAKRRWRELLDALNMIADAARSEVRR